MSRLIPIVFIKKRVRETNVNEHSLLAFHSWRCHGGLLNAEAQHGRGYYVRRLTGQDVKAVMNELHGVKEQLDG